MPVTPYAVYPTMNKVHLRTAIRFLVSFSLLGVLFFTLDVDDLLRGLRHADLRWLGISLAFSIATLACSVWKWRLLIDAHGHRLSWRSLWGFYLLGQLANNFMPSNVGGDVVRVALASRKLGLSSWPAVAGSVLVERMTGLVGLFIALLAGVAVHLPWVERLGILLPVMGGASAVAIACMLIFSKSSNRILAGMRAWPFMEQPVNLLTRLHDACLTYSNQPRLLVQGVLISVLFYVIAAVQLSVLCRMFPGVDVSWSSQLVVFGIISLVAVLPISVNGFGVQESAHTLLLMSLGFFQYQALIIALGLRFILLAPAMAGALVFASSSMVRSAFQRSVPNGMA
ncbi:MAG: flippase-like domain-containing protein [Geminicoccaceae bacterium]|nr:flippase-like domain-containing protein [Geminicoccaceae bacterium]